MAVIVTPCDVKSVISTTLSSDIIQCYIDSVGAKIDACIEASYDRATAKLIKLNLVAYNIAVQGGEKDVESRTAPNGASVKYSMGGESGKTGILANKYGRAVFDLDTNGCYKAIVKSRIAFGTVGQSNRERTLITNVK